MICGRLFRRLSVFILCALISTSFGYSQGGQKFGAAAPPLGTGNVVPAPMAIPFHLTKDLWGGGIANDLLAVQLTISNLDGSHQWQVNDIITSFDPEQCVEAKKVFANFSQADCEARFTRYFGLPTAYSALTQPEVMGLKSVKDLRTKRAIFFRTGTFLVGIASSVSPLSVFGKTTAVGIAMLGGTGLPALGALFPDSSPAQTQRLLEMGYSGHVVIGPNQSATFLIFIPKALIFDKASWSQWKSEDAELTRSIQFFLTSQITGAEITTTPPQMFKSGRR